MVELMGDIDRVDEILNILDAAKAKIEQHAKDIGAPMDCFARIAKRWADVLHTEVDPWQVALCLLDVKIVRASEQPEETDHWVDAAGYAACGPGVL